MILNQTADLTSDLTSEHHNKIKPTPKPTNLISLIEVLIVKWNIPERT